MQVGREGGGGWGIHIIIMRGLSKKPGSKDVKLPPVNVLQEGGGGIDQCLVRIDISIARVSW